MGNTYQAIYDAVRSKISGFNAQELFDRIIRNFDFSHHAKVVKRHIVTVTNEQKRPSVLFRPELKFDVDEWRAQYGKGVYEGVIGTGDSPDEAMRDFDEKWTQKLKDNFS